MPETVIWLIVAVVAWLLLVVAFGSARGRPDDGIDPDGAPVAAVSDRERSDG